MPPQPSKLQEQITWYLTLLVLFLFVTVPPILCSLLYLSQVPEVIWESNDKLSYDRIWLYREGRPLGIAYQSQRPAQQYSPTEVCVETNLYFFLWGRSKDAREANSSRKMILVDNHWETSGEECD